MLTWRSRVTDDRGFTLVEVMVAVALLLVGVLGVVTLVTGANAQTAVTKGREGATNLAREIMDGARDVPYNSLTTTAIGPALRAQSPLADSDSATAGWQIKRRSITYTVTSVPICIIDAQADGYGAHPVPSDPAAAPFCSGQQTGSDDANPDDFRRMDVTLTWTVGAKSYSLRDTTLIINPTGSIGPPISALCRTDTTNDTACPATPKSSYINPGENEVDMLAQSQVADAVTWSVNDGSNAVVQNSSNPSASAGTAWNFAWKLGTVGTDLCSGPINWVLDGGYVLTAQATSGIGSSAVAGQLKPYTATVNRNVPFAVCGLAGGYDAGKDPSNPDLPSRPVAVDLEWKQSPERDIIGYRVYRQAAGAPSRQLVCDTSQILTYPFVSSSCICTSQSSCLDPSPTNGGGTVTYTVYAMDTDASGTVREGTAATLSVDQGGGNQPPDDFPTGSVHVSSSGGLPTITWPAVADPNSSSGDHVAFYRIYRNGKAFANRYDRVDGGTLTYTDQAPSPGGDTYWVTAVDTHYDENTPTQAGP